MNLKKIAAVGAALVMSAGIAACVPVNAETVSPLAIVAEAANSKLAAPKNVKASAGSGKITLTWDKVKGAEVYGVYKYNAKTKKYEQCKIAESEKAIITGLKNGTKYKFKIAAGKENGDSYDFGKFSDIITATPNASEKTEEKSKAKEEAPKMKEIQLSAKEMVGSWVYYDFLYLKKYTAGTKYDPSKLQFNGSAFMTNVLILDDKTAQICYNDSEYGKYSTEYSIKNNKLSDDYNKYSYKIYSYGEDKFLFLQFVNGDGENTYVFKYNPKYTEAITKTPVTDISKLEGRWTATDFCNFDISYIDVYNPLYPIVGSDVYFTSATVTKNEISFSGNDDYWYGPHKIEKDMIWDGKYYVYEINGNLYLYWQFVNKSGDKHFYVFKKN